MNKTKIIFRVDSDPDTGLGHIMRSIVIANELRQKYNADITFVSNPHPSLSRKLKSENYNGILNEKGLSEEKFVNKVSESCEHNIMVIDHSYAYSPECIEALKTTAQVCLVENFCRGSFSADCVIFPSAHLSDYIKNDERWNTGITNFVSGPEFVIINDKVRKIGNKQRCQKKDGKNGKHVVITTGGGDSRKIALKLSEWIVNDRGLFDSAKITVLSGELFIYRKELENILQGVSDNIEFRDFDYSVFLTADLAICTFGVTAYELIYLGIPVLAIGRSRRTAEGARILAERYNIINSLGFIDILSKSRFKGEVNSLLNDPERLRDISNRQLSFLDGRGAERIAEKIMELKGRT